MAQDLDHRLELDRVAALYEQTLSVVAANLATGSFYCFLLQSQGFSAKVWWWMAALLTMIAIRARLFLQFRSVPVTRRVPLLWFKRYAIAIFVTGVLWGSLSGYAVSSDSVVVSFFTVAVLVGLVGGSVATCAVSGRIFLLFTVPTLLPASLVMMWKGPSENVLIGVLVLVYGAIVTRSVFQVKRVILESIRHRLENEDLLEAREREKETLQASEAQLRKAFGELEKTHHALVEQRSLVDREREVSARLRELDRLKDEFLAKTSHELRTPLFGISGLAEALVDDVHGPVPHGAKTDLSLIVSSSQRLARLVDDILDFAKLRHEKLQLKLSTVDLRSLAEIVLVLAGPRVGEKPVALENRIDSSLPPVLGDEDRLQQILHNLVDNAVKFTDEGTVEVSAAMQGDQVRVSVRDTGLGITAEDRSRIFEAFEQAELTAASHHGGTGLGLAVTRKLVELHGGELWLESEVGQGTTFFLTLPAAGELTPGAVAPAVEKSPAVELETMAAKAMPSWDSEDAFVAESVKSGAKKITLLAVDDEPVNLRILSHFLADEDFELLLATGADQALKLLEKRSVDLLLVDIMMPKMSGFDLCREVRQVHSPADLPVIFLTARDRDEDVATGLELGGNDYVVKPFSKSVLLGRIHLHLGLLDAHRNLAALVAEKLAELDILHGFLHICAQCKKIRDDEGQWTELEPYLAARSEAEFSHGLCPSCVENALDDDQALSARRGIRP